MQLMKMAKKSKTAHINGEEPRKDNVKWSEQMDIVLIDALLEQQVNGNRVDGTFTTTAYNNVLKICRDELNYPFDKDHLKNQLKTLKTNFNICHDLFKGLSGFAWNPNTKLFEAEPEVWTTFIEISFWYVNGIFMLAMLLAILFINFSLTCLHKLN